MRKHILHLSHGPSGLLPCQLRLPPLPYHREGSAESTLQEEVAGEGVRKKEEAKMGAGQPDKVGLVGELPPVGRKARRASLRED